MSILVDEKTRVVVQGITGNEGDVSILGRWWSMERRSEQV